MDTQIEKEIIAGVLRRLTDEGYLGSGSAGSEGGREADRPAPNTVSADSGQAPLTLGPADAIGVANPKNGEALKVMRKSTPARILLGRAGARPRTASYLRFQADHAAAVDAVFMDVSKEVLAASGLLALQTVVRDKDEYLMKPELGKKLSEEAKQLIATKVEKGRQVQIIVVDGLSSTSIEANIGDILPALIQGR